MVRTEWTSDDGCVVVLRQSKSALYEAGLKTQDRYRDCRGSEQDLTASESGFSPEMPSSRMRLIPTASGCRAGGCVGVERSETVLVGSFPPEADPPAVWRAVVSRGGFYAIFGKRPLPSNIP